jgi:uncharacterized protein (DUF2267 family)
VAPRTRHSGQFQTEGQAYSALRSVLHALRDRLTVDEAAHLAAQLPMLVRGIYFEGWKPSVTPKKIRHQDEFLESVANGLGRNTDIDPEHATRAVFDFLGNKIAMGELEDIIGMMPHEIRELWLNL